jgi:hypothetical protein
MANRRLTAPIVSGVLNAFGQPAEVCFLTGYRVLAWNKTLLSGLP